ncbi:MAG: hypothetical protein RLZ65_1049 [Actinomycetota bacterium]
MSKPIKLQNRLEYLASTFAWVLLSIYLFVAATFPGFFFINPLEETSGLRIASLFITLIGWVSIALVAPLLLLLFGARKYKAIDYLPFAAAAWPISIFVSQLTVIIQTGVGYWSYLIDYPIFVATDILIPIGLIALSIRMRMEHLD